MVRLICAAALVFASAAAPADEKKPAGPAGTWMHEAMGITINMAFGKEELVITVLNGDNGAVVTNSYTLDGDTVKLKVTKVEEKGTFPDKPPVGLEASFKWKADGDKATLSDFKGVDEAKGVMEGEYAKAKKK